MRGGKRKCGPQWYILRVREAPAGGGVTRPGEGPGLQWPQVQVTNLPGADQRGGSSSERKSPGRKEDARRVPEPWLFSSCGSAALEWLTEQPQAD